MLAPGQVVDLVTDPPSQGCFTPTCKLTFSADSANAVMESDETNNTAMGQCP